ncbi:MAG: FAD:protein FMN transferase [Myxococcota bacterium]
MRGGTATTGWRHATSVVITAAVLGACAGDRPATRTDGPEIETPPTAPDAPFQRFRVPIMGTVLEIVVPAERAEEAARAVVEVFTDVDARMSEWKESSPLSEVNRRAGEAVPVPPELRSLVHRGLRIGDRTDGAFDVTWAALWGLWDFRAEDPEVPAPEEIAERVAKVDHTKVEVDDEAGTVRLDPGMKVGLGGIAKGHALDRAAARLRSMGVEDFLLSAGGQLYAGGTRDGEPWTLGLRDPRGPAADAFASLDVRDASVATSGDYERYFVKDGVRYHHILDPRTGMPARGLRSATVVSRDATLADALATAFVVLGPERSLALARGDDRVEAVLVDPDGGLHVTPGLKDGLRTLHPPRAGSDAAPPMPWIRDDWDAAVARARAEGKPLVVDLWAPWCHTCLSMKHYVFPDPSLRALADRFVWASLDTDREANAEALEHLKPEVWPTFYVVAPDGTLQARHAGATSVEGFRAFLRRGEQAVLEGRDLDRDDPLFHLRRGDRLAAEERYAAAEEAWAAATERAPEGWERTPEVLVRRIRARYRRAQYGGCAKFGRAHLAEAVANRDASAGDFSKYALRCADRQDDEGLARRVREALVAEDGSLRWALSGDGPRPMSTDDRSDAMTTLREAWEALGDEARARTVAERQAGLLDRAVEDAPNPRAEMTWAWPRAEVYVHLGRGEEVLPWLEALAAKLPDEYDPPYRLAWVLHRLGRDDEALPWAERAYEKAYGPRKERIGELLEALRAGR